MLQEKQFSTEIMKKMWQADQFQTTFCCFFKKALYEVKASDLQLKFNVFRQPSTWHTIKTNCIKLKTIDTENMFNFRFLQKGLGIDFHNILCMIFQLKCFSCYFLLTTQISFYGFLYVLRHWAICVMQLFVSQVITSLNFEINLKGCARYIFASLFFISKREHL